jgi:hypothetical protein
MKLEAYLNEHYSIMNMFQPVKGHGLGYSSLTSEYAEHGSYDPVSFNILFDFISPRGQLTA